jgi:N-acyl-phosphatidylethanolamine-hydrolysing phospholipase D
MLAYTWIGHATVVVQLDGLNIITDPVWATVAAPTRFIGPLRYRPPPCPISQLPPIDIVLVSHNHYDHLDYDSILEIYNTFPHCHFFVPMGLRATLVGWGVNGKRVVELNWTDTYYYESSRTGAHAQLVCTPAQHWSQRGVFDGNKTLWSGWTVIGRHHRFYFSGDTGYCEEFRKIGYWYGPFDLAAIPIGNYCPSSMMSPQHVGPVEAIRIHQQVKSKHSVGIHWGAFSMGSTEPYMEPRSIVKQYAPNLGADDGVFVTVDHGDTQVL